MIAIYANWTCSSMALGTTVEDALSKLRVGHDCAIGTKLGSDVLDLTALDVGPEYRYVEHLPPLHRAIQLYPEVAA